MLLSTLKIITLNSAVSDTLLGSISCSSSFGEFPCSFIWGLFFVFPLRLPLCICFCVLGRFAKTLAQFYVRCCLWLALGNCLELWVIHSLWFLLLGLGVCRKNQAVHHGWLLLPVCLGEVWGAYLKWWILSTIVDQEYELAGLGTHGTGWLLPIVCGLHNFIPAQWSFHLSHSQ